MSVVTLDDQLADCQSATSDTSNASQNQFIRWLSKGYSEVMSQFNRAGITATKSTTTNVPSNPLQFSDRSYLTPPNFLFMKTVKILIGSRWYDLTEEEDQQMWDYRTQFTWGGIPSMFFIKDNFGVGASELQINPICTVTSPTGTAYTPTSGSMTGTTLSLTFSSQPFTNNQPVTLAGFIMSSGLTVSGVYYITSVVGNTITVTVPSGSTATITTMGTVSATTGVTMTMTYEATDIQLDHIGITPSQIYSFQTPQTANVVFTHNSTSITSNSALFASWMALGSTYITAGGDGDGQWYKISQVNSSTSATLANVYQSTSLTSNTNWSINQLMNLHPDMVDLPVYYALWKYYLFKKDKTWRDYYKNTYYAELKLAQGNWSTKSRSAIIRSKPRGNRWTTYPSWFPPTGVVK